MLQDLPIAPPVGSRFIGKTVKTVVTSIDESDLLLVFTDGTLAQLSAFPSQRLADSSFDFISASSYALEDLEAAGVTTADEMTDYRKRSESRRQAQLAIQERELYERLKQRFGE